MSVDGNPDRNIACEDALRLLQMEQFRTTLQTKHFKPITQEISLIRLIKGIEEIDTIKACATKLAKAYRIIPEVTRAGMTESDVAFEIMKVMSEQGLDKSDPPLVQSGTNSAIPHSTPSAKKLQKGELLVVDASAPNADGYFADFTRTYSIGKPSPKQKEVYDVVRIAQERGASTPRKGMPAEDVDRTTRSIIESAGYGEYFFHRTGHGLGLEVHEEPYIKSGNKSKLESGMVFTIEPGIYLAGKFGVRIEDNIIIGRSRAENVTSLDHDLIEI
jgi:Xaa-Pro aminopeptidase